MKYYELNEGLKLPKIVMGCMRISEMDYRELEILVMTAVEHGVNHFDHAAFSAI